MLAIFVVLNIYSVANTFLILFYFFLSGVFTMNVVAAPVVYCKKVLGSSEVRLFSFGSA